MENQNDVLNVEMDKQTNTLHVSINRGEGEETGSGEIIVVPDVTLLPLDAHEKDTGAVVKGDSIVFYSFQNGEWNRLSAGSDVSVDNETVSLNPNDEIQAIGLRETNQNQAQRIWIGTKQQYSEQHKERTDDICYIVDDEQTQYVDNSLNKNSLNAVSNHAVTQAMDGSLDSLIVAVGGKLGVTIVKKWNAQNGCWTFDVVG